MTKRANLILFVFFLPGNLVCDLFGLPDEGDHRVILRSFINMVVWSGIAIGAALWVTL